MTLAQNICLNQGNITADRASNDTAACDTLNRSSSGGKYLAGLGPQNRIRAVRLGTRAFVPYNEGEFANIRHAFRAAHHANAWSRTGPEERYH